VKVLHIVGLMRDESTVLLVGSVDNPNDEGTWYTVPPELFARAERGLFMAVVPVFEGGALVDWTPAPAGTNLDASDDTFCSTCEFVEQEYANANASDLTRDALALQNAVLCSQIAGLRLALRNLRVLRSSCADSNHGDFRVHLCEREWDAFCALVADVKPAQPAQHVADMSKVCNNCCYSDGRENCDGGAWFCHRCGAHHEP